MLFVEITQMPNFVTYSIISFGLGLFFLTTTKFPKPQNFSLCECATKSWMTTNKMS